MSLLDLGYRFVIRSGRADWVHAAEMKPGDVDATDMTDEELTAALREAGA